MLKLDILASDWDDTSNTLPSSVEECTAISMQGKGFYFIFCEFFLPGEAIGGQRAKETRLTIRSLTSKEHSRGFLGDLIEAVSRILTGKESYADKNKEKRKVIRVQTSKTSKSLSESISLAKVIFI